VAFARFVIKALTVLTIISMVIYAVVIIKVASYKEYVKGATVPKDTLNLKEFNKVKDLTNVYLTVEVDNKERAEVLKGFYTFEGVKSFIWKNGEKWKVAFKGESDNLNYLAQVFELAGYIYKFEKLPQMEASFEIKNVYYKENSMNISSSSLAETGSTAVSIRDIVGMDIDKKATEEFKVGDSEKSVNNTASAKRVKENVTVIVKNGSVKKLLQVGESSTEKKNSSKIVALQRVKWQNLPKGKYVQIASYKDPEIAKMLCSVAVKETKLPFFVLEKSGMYKVIAGPYSSDKVKDVLKTLKNYSYNDYFIFEK